MGSAIAAGLKSSVSKIELLIVEKNDETRNAALGLTQNVFENLQDTFSKNNASELDAVIIATKPDGVVAVAKQLSEYLNSTSLVVSIAAGIASSTIEAAIGDIPVVRAMPNLSALIGESATAICAGKFTETKHIDLAQQLLLAVGKVVVVEEEQMNLVTAISGSGPAYFFLLTQYLIESGVAGGLDYETARTLVEQTLLGAAKTLSMGSDTVEVLRSKVTSPGGTTAAAIDSFEIDEFNKIVSSAVKAAAKRSEELG